MGSFGSASEVIQHTCAVQIRLLLLLLLLHSVWPKAVVPRSISVGSSW